jgi:chorismate mutase
MVMSTSRRRSVVVGSVAALALALGVASEADAAAAPAPHLSATSALRSLGALGPLTDLAIQRVLVSDQVAASKFGTGTPIDDPVREQQELDQVRQSSIGLGLDPNATVRFFADQINASKIVQRGLFQRWSARPSEAPTTRPDLGKIRTQLDQLTTELLQQLNATQHIRRSTLPCSIQRGEARVSGEIINRLDALHRRAVDVAVQSVCSPQ